MKLFEPAREVSGSSTMRADQRAATTLRACVLLLLLTAGSLVVPTSAPAAEGEASKTAPRKVSQAQGSTDRAARTATGSKDSAADTAQDPKAKAVKSIEDEPLDKELFAPDDKDDAKAAKKDDGGAIGRLLFGLACVVGLIYAVHWVLKKYGNGRPGVSNVGAAGVIDVLATTPLGPDRALHLVRVGDEVVLVGATSQSLTHLRTLSSTGSVDATAAAMGGADFQRQLAGAMGSTVAQSASVGTSSYSPSMLAAMSGGAVPPAHVAGAATGRSFIQRFLTNLQMMTAR